ncbi:cation-transporting ATPase [Promicromonospora sp. MEB111]|uniref:cation-transporting ATPase n=1 Tax=Promicromonospora sp. MEB111 TaxID=3040301 RepID=UPI00254EC0B3|nr:cation-transporting ATPase [Promicromonospora sp. MEB111]
MSKLTNMIGLAKKMLDSQNGQQQQQGAPQGGTTGQRSWQSTLQDIAGAVTGRDQQQGHAPAPQGYPATQQGYPTGQQAYPAPQQGYPAAAQGRPGAPGATDADRQAIARYDYLMQTADPHQIERIHAESFARLTPAQRQEVLQRMQTELPPHEQPRSADPVELSRAAARTEARRPGSMRSVLAKVGTGGVVAGVAVGAVGILGAVAAGAIVSSVAGPILENAANLGVDFESLAAGVDVEGLTAAAGEFGTGALGEAAAGIGEYGTGALGEAAAGVSASVPATSTRPPRASRTSPARPRVRCPGSGTRSRRRASRSRTSRRSSTRATSSERPGPSGADVLRTLGTHRVRSALGPGNTIHT